MFFWVANLKYKFKNTKFKMAAKNVEIRYIGSKFDIWVFSGTFISNTKAKIHHSKWQI